MLIVAAAVSGCVANPLGDPFKADAGSDSEVDASEKSMQKLPGTGNTKDNDKEPPAAGGSLTDDDARPAADSSNKGFAGGDDYQGPVLSQPSRGAAIALSQDEKTVVVVNRDAGSLSILTNVYDADGKKTLTPKLVRELDLGKGSEPWQVAIGPDDDTAYVVLRREQQLVKIVKLKSYPEIYGKLDVGSEPTSVALSPSGRTAYVANWNDGTVSLVDTTAWLPMSSIDLNAPLVATGYLGKVKPRPALAHPRSLTVTNDGDQDDSDESLLVTEYFAQQIEELRADGLNADVNKTGLVYKVKLADSSVKTIKLAPLSDIGFKDTNGEAAGCFPNQLQSITVLQNYAYVVSVCAAPEGPEGIKITTTACQSVEDCKAPELKLVDPVCDVVAQGAAPVCQDVANFKTATSPVVSVVDIAAGNEVIGGAHNLSGIL